MPEAAGLDDEDLIRLNVGAFSADAGMAGIIGNSSMSVAGAAGETAQTGNIPVLNIHRSVLCGRNYEYFSKDPLISGVFAAALPKGVQRHPGCVVTIKHFAANNQETNRYNNSSMVSERALREIYLKGFEICIREARPRALMTSYNLLNGIHTSEYRELLQDVLRCEFGFDGIVMTDWVVSSDVLDTEAKYPVPEAYKVAFAGNDLFMPGSQGEVDNLREALESGKISREQLMENATRICRMALELNSAKSTGKRSD